MATRRASNTFLQQWKGEKSFGDDIEPPGSHRGECDYISQSRILDIERAERAERTALIQRAERLCASQRAHSNAVLERLGFSVQQDPLRSPQYPASPRGSPESSLRGGRVLDETPATRRRSRLPVKTSGAGNDGCPHPSAKDKIQDIVETLERFQLVHRPSPQPPAAPRRTTVVPAPPSKAATTNRREPRRGTNLRAVKAVSRQVKDDVQPLAGPVESLSLCLRQLNSEDWEKKMDGFKSVQSLARHHPQLLQTKLHDICLILTEEVKNLRSVVASAAMDTITELHIHLGKAMDPEAERTGRVLLLKLAQTTSTFIHQQANLALDALVKGCSPSKVVRALLNTGLSHLCAAVRSSTAQHLHQLADIIGKDQILTAGKIFAERFITAISKMSVDAAPEVRHHGQRMLQELAQQKEFMVLWNKVIPVKDRCPLEKILKRLRQ